MTCRDQVNLFRELFPHVVIEKWYCETNDHFPSIKVITTDHEYYKFSALSRTIWMIHRCKAGFVDVFR